MWPGYPQTLLSHWPLLSTSKNSRARPSFPALGQGDQPANSCQAPSDSRHGPACRARWTPLGKSLFLKVCGERGWGGTGPVHQFTWDSVFSPTRTSVPEGRQSHKSAGLRLGKGQRSPWCGGVWALSGPGRFTDVGARQGKPGEGGAATSCDLGSEDRSSPPGDGHQGTDP